MAERNPPRDADYDQHVKALLLRKLEAELREAEAKADKAELELAVAHSALEAVTIAREKLR